MRRLIIAFSAGLSVSEPIREFSTRHPDVETDIVPARWWEPDAPLRDGRAQIGYLRKPFDETGMRVVPVGHDPRVACLPATHPLAAHRELTLADLDGERMLDPQKRRASSLEEKFELIASGFGLALVPLSVARAYVRPDLVHRPVTDAPASETCLVVPADQRGKLVREFLDIAVSALR
ncbi:LysR family substrate-binding domain-containing protein [Nocardia tengchongensis]|uniref:LysR family substrate-binding domain-containing protein n=1 Tax=Nocardia tengchongensis TaxID=2055889 RepID=UPI0036BC3BC2